MFWNAEVDYADDNGDELGPTLYYTVFAADAESAKSIILDKSAEDSPDYHMMAREISEIVKVKRLDEILSISAIKDAVDEALTHGIPDDFIKSMYELTKER